MNENVLEILRKTYEEYGDELFSDNLKLKAYLADLLVDYPVEKKRLLLAVNENIVKKLVSEKSELSRCAVYSGVLVDTYALPEDVAGDIVEAFYLAINGDVYMVNKETPKEESSKTIITEVSKEIDDTVSKAWETDVKDKDEPIIHEEKETNEDNINNYSSTYSKSAKAFAWVLLGILALAILIVLMTFNNNENYEDITHSDDTTYMTEQEQSYEKDYINIPDWYIVGEVAVKGNQVCFSRDDGLVMENDVMPTTVTVYTSDESGYLVDMTEYIIFETEDLARYHCERLNNYDEGTNSFGMSPGEAYYYYCENVLLVVFDENYYGEEYGTLQNVIDMFAGYGWTMNYLD